VITVTNQAPVAEDDSGVGYTTDSDTPLTTGNVLDNDSDPDGDAFSVTGYDDSMLKGTLISNGDGTFSYDPDGQFDSLIVGEQATDTFTYTINDGYGGSDTAMVTITIIGVAVENVLVFLPAIYMP
jgi:VCBS repeat-containing protein